MRRYHSGYLSATRHPLPCLLFLLPLLAAYEAGVVWLGGTKPEALRNGADSWLRWGLEALGLQQLYCAPALVILVFLCWSMLRSWDRPERMGGVWLGMILESILLALGLWALSRSLAPLLTEFGIRLQWAPPSPALTNVVTFVGAGIYEEVLFRLAFFFLFGYLFQFLDLPRLVTAMLLTVASALVFAAAHHVGPYGEAFNGYVFLFRALAGFYFALIYQVRGFGIAVGTHVGYDLLVGVVMTHG
jgi:hypothetical protein